MVNCPQTTLEISNLSCDLFCYSSYFSHQVAGMEDRVRKGGTQAAHTKNVDASFLNATVNSLN